MTTQRGHRRHAFAPRFPKPKLAGWWLVMGEADELLVLFALKRIHLNRGALTSELHFAAPDEPGEYLQRPPRERLVHRTRWRGAGDGSRVGLRRRCVSCIAPGARAWLDYWPDGSLALFFALLWHADP
jgi:hypothetical protein